MRPFTCGSYNELFADHDCEGATYCCFGAAQSGNPAECTCWEAIYDLEQVDPDRSIEPGTRSEMCADCAYRANSPERTDDDKADELLSLPGSGATFWCHQGIRRPILWRHPDGCTRPGDPADYCPPIVERTKAVAVPYKADGSPADRCAGWATRAALPERVRS